MTPPVIPPSGTARHAVVTGATKGIGRAIAEKLLREGLSVTVCARTGADLLLLEDTWARQFPAAEIRTFAADLSQKESTERFAEEVLRSGRPVDLLVNNVGRFEQGKISEDPEGLLEGLMAANLYAAYHLTRALLPRMKQQGYGHIFNTVSVAGGKPFPNSGAYGITKYALMGFSDNLREELRPSGIRVTALCPGATWTDSWSGSGMSPARLMQASDVADMLWAAFTLSASAAVETIIMRPQPGDL